MSLKEEPSIKKQAIEQNPTLVQAEELNPKKSENGLFKEEKEQNENINKEELLELDTIKMKK